jgi:hypothetical protein
MTSAISKNRSPRACSRTYRLLLFRANIRRLPIWVCRTSTACLVNDGWWNYISEAEKDAFIDGYTTAMSRANSLTVAMCQSKMKEAQPGATSFNEKFYGGMDLCYVGQTFAFKVEKPLKPQLDEFYKEPLNVRIPAQYAMEYVRDEIVGKKTAGQLLDELNDWREIMNGPPR